MCVKMGKELPGLARDPLGGELGKRIFEQVSQEAWNLWLEHQKMLLNEFRLNLADKKARTFLTEQAEKFFFGEGAQLPPDFRPAPRKG
ncbi:MAG: oxidative damage protection protein [Deltaproteobacteria bacterium]|nr:oxidative damage protection protein [Deltaproteobacteria bacterium]